MTAMEPQQTPIESRSAWTRHRAVYDKARAMGACFDCAQWAGLAATDRKGEKTTATLHPRCVQAMTGK